MNEAKRGKRPSSALSNTSRPAAALRSNTRPGSAPGFRAEGGKEADVPTGAADEGDGRELQSAGTRVPSAPKRRQPAYNACLCVRAGGSKWAKLRGLVRTSVEGKHVTIDTPDPVTAVAASRAVVTLLLVTAACWPYNCCSTVHCEQCGVLLQALFGAARRASVLHKVCAPP